MSGKICEKGMKTTHNNSEGVHQMSLLLFVCYVNKEAIGFVRFVLIKDSEPTQPHLYK